MDFLRNELFARTAFTHDQDRGIAGRDHARQMVDALHRLGIANHAAQIDPGVRQVTEKLSIIFGRGSGSRGDSAVDQFGKPRRYWGWRSASDQQLASVGVQCQQLKVRIPDFHDTEEFIQLKIRQIRIEQEDSIVSAMFLEQLERSSTASRLNHIPTRKSQLVIQILAEPGVGTDNEHIDRYPILLTCELRDETCHEAYLLLPVLKGALETGIPS
jgi:hypothetical protein